jgi:ATP-dependent RNA helicase DHX8/PRP22
MSIKRLVPVRNTGRDLNPQSVDGRNPDKPRESFFSEAMIGMDMGTKKARKRLTSPERFEITQLIASGVLDPKDYPDLDDDALNYDDREEELDIEVRQEEPAFLAGQTKSSLDLSPIRIVKNPDGTMNRAAMAGASLAKERRDIRQQQQRAEAEDKEMTNGAIKENRGMFEQKGPEWKQKVFNKTATFGKRTSLSMKEQREQLPIYKLRETLIKAVDDNQILIVVGETGSGIAY